MDKVCARCGISKDLNDYNNKSSAKDGKQPYCRKCNSEFGKSYMTKDEKNTNSRQNKTIIRKWLQAQREHTLCSSCGTQGVEFYPKKLVSDGLSKKYSLEHIQSTLTYKTTAYCQDCYEKSL